MLWSAGMGWISPNDSQYLYPGADCSSPLDPMPNTLGPLSPRVVDLDDGVLGSRVELPEEGWGR